MTSKKLIFILFHLLIYGIGSANGQKANSTSNSESNAIWSLIESCMESLPTDSILHQIRLLVRENCKQDYDCRYKNLDLIQQKLEIKFDLTTAIAVCEEMVAIGQRMNDLNAEADARLNMSRFYDALGQNKQAAIQDENAERLYKAAGNQSALIRIQTNRLNKSSSFNSPDETIAGLNALLNQAIAINDTINQGRILIYLIQIALAKGDFDFAEKQVDVLEQMPISDPVKKSEYKYLLFAALGRGDIALAKGKLPSAVQHFQKALTVCEDEPSPWMEIRTMCSLAKIEWEQGNTVNAEQFINLAEKKATYLELHDHLANIYGIKAKFAEAEGNFANALNFTKKQAYHEDTFMGRSAGFNLETHAANKKVERLAAEKDRHVLSIKEKDIQIGIAIIIIGIGVVVLTGLTMAFYHQKKQKKN